MFDSLIHWLFVWFVDSLIGSLVWLFDWLIGLIVWFIDWLFICLIDWFIDSLIVWLVDWLVDLINWFIVLIPSSNSLLALRMIGWPSCRGTYIWGSQYLRYFDRNLGKPMGFPLWKIEKNTSPCAKWLYDQPGKLATSPLGSFFLNFEAPELEPDRPGTVRWPQPLKP